MRFRDRKEAGRLLAERLEPLRGQDVVVLGLPRGGVPVGAEVARASGCRSTSSSSARSGCPFQHELAMGAVGEGGVLVVNERVVRLAHVGPEELERAERRERAELESRVHRFRGERPRVPLEGRTAVVVDDGIATGSTARAACAVARALGAARIVLAAPVCARESARVLASDADEMVCLETPRDFHAVGQFYVDFRPTEDGEVSDLLERARPGPSHAGNAGPPRRGGPGERRVGPARRPSRRPGARPRAGGLRARQRQQPAQPAQPVRREAPRGSRPRDPAVRPADPAGGGPAGRGLRHRPPRDAAGGGDGVGADPAGLRVAADRLVRRQHGRRCRPAGRGRARRRRRRRGVAGRPARPGRAAPRARAGAHVADRGRRATTPSWA